MNAIALPVPHRHYVFALPVLLRSYFQYDRPLLGELFRSAIASLTEYLREEMDLPDGKIAVVAVVHTFGEYLDFHPHVHMLVTDGLFDEQGSSIPPVRPGCPDCGNCSGIG